MIEEAKRILYKNYIFTLIRESTSIEPDENRGFSLKLKLTNNHLKYLNEFSRDSLPICTEIKNGNRALTLNQINEEMEVKISLSPNEMKRQLGFGFYLTFDDFIKQNTNELIDSFFFIKEQNIYSNQMDQNELLKTYQIILLLQQIFQDNADYVDEDEEPKEYIFFDTKKIKINADFKKADIEEINESCPNFAVFVQRLFDELEIQAEKATRRIFFKKALELCFEDRQLSMTNILNNFKKVFEEYEAHYRAYINSLEPKKIKYEFEQEHNSLLKELNSLLGDVHNKIIFIPIAFILGGSQLASGGWGKATMILFGMWTFSIFISIFLDTHEKVLHILDLNIESKKKFYEKENISLYHEFEEKIDKLKKLSQSVLTRMTITRYTNWGLTSIVAIVYYFLYK